MKTLVKLALAVALVVMGCAAPAAADTISVSDVTLPYYETLTVAGFSTGGTYNYTFATDTNVLAGQIVLTTNIGNLGTWCVDLFHFITLKTYNPPLTYTTVDLATNNSGPGPSNSNTLTSTQIAQIQSLAAYGNANLPLQSGQAAKNAFSAAVQAAIWQVEYPTTVTGGDTAFANDLANIWTLLTNNQLPAGGGVQLENLDGSVFSTQNFEFPVPEPGTLALVGSLLVALGLLRRRLRLPGTSSI